MTDPTNQLPTPPEFVRALDEATKHAAEKLGCMVVLIAVQENGKCATSVEGVPETGMLAEMAENPAALLMNVAVICRMQDEYAAKAVKS